MRFDNSTVGYVNQSYNYLLDQKWYQANEVLNDAPISSQPVRSNGTWQQAVEHAMVYRASGIGSLHRAVMRQDARYLVSSIQDDLETARVVVEPFIDGTSSTDAAEQISSRQRSILQRQLARTTTAVGLLQLAEPILRHKDVAETVQPAIEAAFAQFRAVPLSGRLAAHAERSTLHTLGLVADLQHRNWLQAAQWGGRLLRTGVVAGTPEATVMRQTMQQLRTIASRRQR